MASPSPPSADAGARSRAESAGGTGWTPLADTPPLAILARFLRQIPIMAVIFLLLLIPATLAILRFVETEYASTTRLFVRLGDEYVFNPLVGDAGAGASATQEQIIQAEVEIFESATVRERALDVLGLEAIYPDLAEEYLAASGADRPAILIAARKALVGAFNAAGSPTGPIIEAAFTHKDPEIAQRVMQALLDEYLGYRREVLVGDGGDAIAAQRAALETRLDGANATLERFLRDNGLGEFEADRAAVQSLVETLTDDLLATQTRVHEFEGRLSAIRARLAETPPEIELFNDDERPAELQALELEREELLARYLPGSQPVRDIDARIARMRAALESGAGAGLGLTRRGVNPVYQTLISQRLQAEADLAAFRQSERSLRGQLDAARARQREFQALASQYGRLARDRDTLEQSVLALAQREQDARASRDFAEQASNNIRVIDAPDVPIEGSSLKRPFFALAVLLSGAVAAAVGGLLTLASLERRPPPKGPQSRRSSRGETRIDRKPQSDPAATKLQGVSQKAQAPATDAAKAQPPKTKPKARRVRGHGLSVLAMVREQGVRS
ncbi:MAG: GumC family protein [Maricaulaceae bacterium]